MTDTAAPGQVQRTVLLLHGVRTFGRWPDRLARLLTRDGTRVVIYHYARLGMVVFMIPGVRHILVPRLRRVLRRHADLWAAPRVHVVAHSFGSYLVTQVLKGLPEGEGPAVDTMILTGSVLKQAFPWAAWTAPGGRVRRVVNECGELDIWPTMAQLF